jgi:hypothetical protein
MTIVPECSGWVIRLDRRISLIIITGAIINTHTNRTPIKEVVVEVVVVEVVELKGEIDLTKAEAEVKVKVEVVADVAVVMLTVMPYTHQIKRRSDGRSECQMTLTSLRQMTRIIAPLNLIIIILITTVWRKTRLVN